MEKKDERDAKNERPRVSEQTTRPGRASGYEYADALSRVMHEKGGEGPAHAPPPPGGRPPRGGFYLALGFLAFLAISGWNLYAYYGPVEPPAPETQRRAAQILLFSAVDAIETHRGQRGSLPSHLSLLSLPSGNYEYVRADTGYTIYVTMPDVIVSYRSGDDVQQLLEQAGVR